MAAWLLLTFLVCLHKGLNIPLSHTKEHRCLKNVIHQIDSKNEWLLLSASLTAKFGLDFVLKQETALRGFISKSTERVKVLLKNGTRDFQNSLPSERSECFYVTISVNFERFQYFNFETDFLGNYKHF